MRKIRHIFNKSIVTNTLITVGFRIALVIALLTTLSYFYIYSQIEASKLAELQNFTRERGARESQIFKLAQDNHQLLKQDILKSYQPPVNQVQLAEFNRNFVHQQDGAVRYNPDHFDASQIAGMWVAADVELTDDIRHRTVLFNRLVSQYGKAWRNRFINTYALGPENFATVYWPEIPDFTQRMAADFDIRQEEYFSISTRENNPSQQTVWTGLYRDKQADMWMVSVETPIYYQQRHIATIGNDISLDELFQRTIAVTSQGGYNLIFRDDGRLIADPHYIDQLKASSGDFIINRDGDASLKSIYEAVTTNHSDQQILELDQQDAYLMVTRIPGPNWFYVRVIPRSVVAAQASGNAAIVFLFGLAALVIELLVLCMVMKRKITWPLLQLTRATMAVARGHRVKELKGTRPDELGRLARAFNNMSHRLATRDKQLAKSAQALEDQLQQLKNSETLFRNSFHNSPINMAIVGVDGKILQANENLCKTFGYSEAELSDLMFYTLVHPNERHLTKDKLTGMARGEVDSYEIERMCQRKDGSSLWCQINVFVQKDLQGKPDYIFIQSMDITKRRQAESKLNRLAFHDPLTSLANRTLLIEFLSKAVSRYQRNNRYKFAVLFLDIDGFKLVNDSLGHLEGDKLLIAIAQRLQAQTRGSDTLARFGGDEFCILLNDITDQDQVVELSQRINQSLRKPFVLGDEVINTNASIGIVLASKELSDAQEYLRDADSAMYHAKHQGPGRYAIFDASMHKQAKAQLRLRNELSAAFQDEQFVPYYQPLVSVESGRICGFESLVRWQHPERGLLGPFQFLEIAEDMHRIAEIDYFIVNEAMAQIVRWRTQLNRDDLTISCNCSSEMLASYKVIDRIRALLDKHQLPSHCLNLEITESVLINDPETTLEILHRLQQLGVKIHLDDFGTGYSSLSYLHRFPIHNIKIDRSFVSRIIDSEKDHAIVESIVLLANRLGITITAEGVETQEQYEMLERIGVTKTQGYYHGKPVDAGATLALLEDDPVAILLNKTKA